ncbi:hypothetical protein [Halococcus salsus]|uniref:hypothetical protein n=1 Tax=Halococcus salsus TaxID=2162894 RepID=UPI001359EB7F|nr:hypothetical protein [Halococcus salsus]
MPISEEIWEAGISGKPWLSEVYNFLDEGYPKAYSPIEITNELFEIGEDEAIQSMIVMVFVDSMLELLIDKEVAEARVIDEEHAEYSGNTYYRRAEKP